VNLPEHQPCPACGVPQCEYNTTAPEMPQTCEHCGHEFILRDWRMGELHRVCNNGLPVFLMQAPVWLLRRHAVGLGLGPGESWRLLVNGGAL